MQSAGKLVTPEGYTVELGGKPFSGRTFNIVKDTKGKYRVAVANAASAFAERLKDSPKLLAAIKKLPDKGKRFIEDFANASDDVLKKFKEKPGLVDGWRVLDDAGLDKALRSDPDKLTKVNRYLDNNPTKKDGFIDDLKKTSDPGKFVDRTSWKDDIVQQYGDDINQFQTQGLSRSDLPESLVDDMVDASSAPPSFIDQAINDAINAGSDIPIKKAFSQGDELFKIVPKGGTVSDFTPFWVTKAEWDNVKNLSNLEQKLGLPIGSHAVEYNVCKITANQTGNIF